MTSGTVYRVKYAPPDPKTYGFQYLPQREVHAISRRLYSTHTRTTESNEVERRLFAANPESIRRTRPHSCCPRSAVTEFDPLAAIAFAQAKSLTNEDLQKIIRRLQRPTTSFEMTAKATNHKEEEPEAPAAPVQMSEEAQHNVRKKIERLRRPTTSTLLKKLGACGYCDDKNIDTEKFNAKVESEKTKEQRFTAAEYQIAITRSRVPTQASLHGKNWCAKYLSETKNDLIFDRQSLPLLSGLRRSPNSKAITSRLHYSKSTNTNETPFTIF